MRVVPAILGGLLAATAVHAVEVAPGVVVDDRGSAVFLTSPERRLEARDVVTGALRWSSAEAVRPLAAAAGRVLAQADAPAGRFDLVLLESASGRRIAAEAMPLPDGVTAPIDEVLGTRFDIRVEQVGPQVRIDWRFEQRPVRGALLEDGEEVRRAEGAVIVDMTTARFATAAPRAIAQGPPLLPSSLETEAAAGAFRERPLRIGALFVATQESGDGSLRLKRWTDTGAPLPDAPLPRGVTLQMGSADGAHALVSAPAAEGAPERAHAWTVVSLATGLAVAAFRAPTGAAPFVVASGRVLVVAPPRGYRTAGAWREEPRRIEAFDIGSGGVAWTHRVRDFAYRGPVAP